ncbi:GSCFA domain-containing protein [Pararhizobium sp. A13]|uniref:GSCFA domain-containing protein n=1 Tax=Pararhizobium sp. A13 TaxID=3133975 RepID=UPI00311AC444
MSLFEYVQDGEVKKASGTFFRGESTNFHPTNDSFSQPNFLSDYLMKGWEPSSKFVTKDTPIVAFGSCFAANISNYLHSRGYNVLTKKDNRAYITRMGDGIVNTSAILQQFEWAWLNKAPEGDLWHGYKAQEFGYEESVRLDTKALLDSAGLFVITLGLSEIWYDEVSGEVFWRAVPKDKYDPSRHKFRVATHAETLANLEAIRSIIRKFRPDAHILFSVSPIPLTATFRPVSCLTADAVSKAIIRGALDEFLRNNDKDECLHYMPSYEAVTRLFNNQWTVDRRHIHPHVLRFNMQMFETFFCNPGLTSEQLAETFRSATEEDLKIGMNGHESEGLTYSEIRRLRSEEKREKRRQVRIQERINSRAAERQLKIAERKDQVRSKGGIVATVTARIAVGLLALQGALALVFDWTILAVAVP